MPTIASNAIWNIEHVFEDHSSSLAAVSLDQEYQPMWHMIIALMNSKSPQQNPRMDILATNFGTMISPVRLYLRRDACALELESIVISF